MWTWIKDKTTLSSAFISVRTSDRNSTGIQAQCSDSLYPQGKTSCTFAVCFANDVFLPAFKLLQSFVRLNQCLLSKSWIITALLSWPASQWTLISVCINWCLWLFFLPISFHRRGIFLIFIKLHVIWRRQSLYSQTQGTCQSHSDPDYMLTYINHDQRKRLKKHISSLHLSKCKFLDLVRKKLWP